MLEISGQLTVNGDVLPRARVNELKVCGMKSDAINVRF
jgi:hypothetical protein